MIFKKSLIFLLVSVFCLSHAFAQEEAPDADQQISDFSLAGYGEKGKKTWDIAGKSADIFEQIIKLKDITGNLYGEDEDVKLTARKGRFNKTNGKIHVEDNVVITTSSGAKLTTNSLDWDRVNYAVSTPDVVNIWKDNLFTKATGACGEPNLNKMNLEKDVTVEIMPQPKEKDSKAEKEEESKIVITCDGPLEIDYGINIATFNNNVKVDRSDTQIYSDAMDVYFGNKSQDSKEGNKESPSFMGSSIDKIVARGNVKTVRGENLTYSDEAVYNGADKKIILSGNPRLIIVSTEDFAGLSQGD